ncbi:hypothetical protein ABKA04_003666 [Annulohypoxylon sp. FPYF3050]
MSDAIRPVPGDQPELGVHPIGQVGDLGRHRETPALREAGTTRETKCLDKGSKKIAAEGIHRVLADHHRHVTGDDSAQGLRMSHEDEAEPLQDGMKRMEAVILHLDIRMVGGEEEGHHRGRNSANEV